MSTAHGDWLFDLGNTRLKFASLGADGRMGAVQARAHARHDWCDGLPAGGTAWVCSVASHVRTLELLEWLAARFRRTCIARTPARFDGLHVAYAHPGRMGVDRFLAMLGARATGAGPWLVVGVGTALTIDLLAGDGRHAGGRIAPSPTAMREALHARAAHLPAIGGRAVEFADDTTDALASGCEGAALALVERSAGKATALLGTAPRLVLHGGGAAALAPALPGAQLVPTLVLDGLARWAMHLAARG